MLENLKNVNKMQNKFDFLDKGAIISYNKLILCAFYYVKGKSNGR